MSSFVYLDVVCRPASYDLCCFLVPLGSILDIFDLLCVFLLLLVPPCPQKTGLPARALDMWRHGRPCFNKGMALTMVILGP